MRRNLRAFVCAAGIGAMGLCLVGCNRNGDRSFGWDKPGWAEGTAISDTGVTGSSASPYTEGKPVYHNYDNTGYTGSSAAPNRSYRDDTRTYDRDTRYRDHSTDTRPGMYNDKKDGDCSDHK